MYTISNLERNPDDVEKEVLNLLCGSDYPWTWGGDAHQSNVSFERDGTGAVRLPQTHVSQVANTPRLNCGENQRNWISVRTTWSFSSKPVRVNADTWTIAITMTLSTCMALLEPQLSNHLKGTTTPEEHLRNPPPPSEAPFRWAPLRSAAFRSKQYNLTLSHGSFIEPFHNFLKPPYPILQSGPNRFRPNRFYYQLVFDKAPYPPREEWAVTYMNGLGASLNYHEYWVKTYHVRMGIPKKDLSWKDTFDLGWWFSPTVGESHSKP